MARLPILVIILSLLESINSHWSDVSDAHTLSKALGFSINGLEEKLDPRLSKEFMEQYRIMRKASQESFENFEMAEKRNRRVVGDEDELKREESGQSWRRSGNKLQSGTGRRRALCQERRRERLNHQGLRSHMHYARQTNLEYVND